MALLVANPGASTLPADFRFPSAEGMAPSTPVQPFTPATHAIPPTPAGSVSKKYDPQVWLKDFTARILKGNQSEGKNNSADRFETALDGLTLVRNWTSGGAELLGIDTAEWVSVGESVRRCIIEQRCFDVARVPGPYRDRLKGEFGERVANELAPLIMLAKLSTAQSAAAASAQSAGIEPVAAGTPLPARGVLKAVPALVVLTLPADEGKSASAPTPLALADATPKPVPVPVVDPQILAFWSSSHPLSTGASQSAAVVLQSQVDEGKSATASVAPSQAAVAPRRNRVFQWGSIDFLKCNLDQLAWTDGGFTPVELVDPDRPCLPSTWFLTDYTPRMEAAQGDSEKCDLAIEGLQYIKNYLPNTGIFNVTEDECKRVTNAIHKSIVKYDCLRSAKVPGAHRDRFQKALGDEAVKFWIPLKASAAAGDKPKADA